MKRKLPRQQLSLRPQKPFAAIQLKSTGSEPWRVLFELPAASPNCPPIRTKSFLLSVMVRCAYCAAAFAESAGNRLERFEQFIKDEAASEAMRQAVALRNVRVCNRTENHFV